MEKIKNKIAVLIPCYNESKTIKKVIKDYKKALPEADIYVYDNNSSDGTDEIAKKEGAIVKYEEDQELIEDVAVENQQAIEMTSIYREILSVTMEGYANIINNNQNNIMKILTSITLLLSIPTLISGIWGMNTTVPGEGSWWGFIGVTIATVVICIVVGILLHKKKLL